MVESLILSLTVFALATFIGHSVITKVPPTLHTPLMSGTNAISGIVIVGALVAAGMTDSALSQGLATAAVVLATINVVGGFLVTDRMLRMFRRRERPSNNAGNPDGGDR
ncbi:MAG: NAD(P) transhydrogenase subunit alpha [Dehalococcoidia bacterium]|nr:NAD(P) transhydrogenase subunit alpha [Dehalococcoidia bacterium]